MTHIVILGGGYGGHTILQDLLQGELPDRTALTLIDRMPYQGLKTEYYALAAGTVAEADIRVPFPADPRLTIRYGEVIGIDLDRRQVLLQEDDPVSFDLLCIGLGCTDRYHGIPGADLYTHSIQTFASSRRTCDILGKLKPYSQVTVVGGGLSGVELASELRESRSDLNIRIVDRGAGILSAFPERLQNYVKAWFHEHHVELLAHINTTRVEPNRLCTEQGTIDTDVTVWTAGIQPVEVVRQLDVPKDGFGRVIVDEHHRIPSHPHVFVVGDCASLPHSPSAQLAEAQGRQIADVIKAELWGQPLPVLSRIKLKGVLGSLGKKQGFGVMGTRAIVLGRVPRILKSGVLWKSRRHFG
jgi:NADH dehydrogenase